MPKIVRKNAFKQRNFDGRLPVGSKQVMIAAGIKIFLRGKKTMAMQKKKDEKTNTNNQPQTKVTYICNLNVKKKQI